MVVSGSGGAVLALKATSVATFHGSARSSGRGLDLKQSSELEAPYGLRVGYVAAEERIHLRAAASVKLPSDEQSKRQRSAHTRRCDGPRGHRGTSLIVAARPSGPTIGST